MWRHLFYPLLPYRSFLVPIVVAWGIVGPCWVAVRAYYRRRHAPAVPGAREVLLLTFVLYLAGLAAVTLTPNESARVRAAGAGGLELKPTVASLTCTAPTLPRGSRARAFCLRNAQGNVALFFPFGLLVPLVWPSVRFGRGLLFALALSCSIELAQYVSSAWGSYRAADVNDVLLNVVGASAGLAVVAILPWRRGARLGVPA
jgi:glycopeptide antibiotics resistance protein